MMLLITLPKKEYHTIKGKKTPVYVHRKGATRAFGPGREEVPKNTGQLDSLL